MKITISVSGQAERLLQALCEISGDSPEEIARDGVATAINAFNYERVDSRGLMTHVPGPAREPVGPDLMPGEAERVRELARVAVESATLGGDRKRRRERIRALWPEGMHSGHAD